MLIGTVLSPYIFDAVDYYGCYGLAISFNALVTIYFLFVIKEIPKPSSHDASKICEKDYPKTRDTCDMVSNSSYPAVNGKAVDEKQNSDMPCCNFFSQIKTVFMIAVRSFIDMVAVVLRKRKGRLQILILLIMSIYALFWFAVEEMLMQYNYLLATFPGFDDEGQFIPLHKRGDKLLGTNYRPVSHIIEMSKLVEYVVHKQVCDNFFRK